MALPLPKSPVDKGIVPVQCMQTKIINQHSMMQLIRRLPQNKLFLYLQFADYLFNSMEDGSTYSLLGSANVCTQQLHH